MSGKEIFDRYLAALRKRPVAEKTEHTDRSALETLLNAFAEEAEGKPQIQHEPKRVAEKGAPDFKVTKAGLILGYVENKAIGENLNKVLKSEQVEKYKSLSRNILLTDYLEFVWIGKDGIQRETLCHESDLEDRKVKLRDDRVAAVTKLLQGFFSSAPEGIGRSQQLGLALATRSKLLRDYLGEELIRQEKVHQEGRLYGLFQTFRDQIFHELTLAEFADAFAQMLAYGLFLARLNAGAREKIRAPFCWKCFRGSFENIGGADSARAGLVVRDHILKNIYGFGGIPFTIGPLLYLLKNRTYIGEINHRGKIYAGEHEPLLDGNVFEAVQARLLQNLVAGHTSGSSNAALLGIIFDDRGNVMAPSHTQKGRRRYYYYISRAFIEGRKGEAGSVPRVAASDIEPKVFAALRSLTQARIREKSGAPETSESRRQLIEGFVERITIGKDSIQIQFKGDLDPPPQQLLLDIPWKRKPGRLKREILFPQGAGDTRERPIKAKARKSLVRAIGLGRTWLQELVAGKVSNLEAIAVREGRCERSVSLIMSLAFLAPDIVEAAVAGTLPRGFGVTKLMGLPLLWHEQREALSR